MDLKFFLEDLFNKKVDLATRRSLKPQLTEKILKEAIYLNCSVILLPHQITIAVIRNL